MLKADIAYLIQRWGVPGPDIATFTDTGTIFLFVLKKLKKGVLVVLVSR